jgi:capsular polysaccharide biosynthesis protein
MFGLALGMIVAVFAAFGCALLAECLDPSIRNEMDVATVSGMPVLAMIDGERISCSYLILD